MGCRSRARARPRGCSEVSSRTCAVPPLGGGYVPPSDTTHARGLRPGSRLAGAPAGGLALARRLGRVDRDGDREVQRGADDPVLLHRVRGRVALARRRALGPADVAELERGGEHLEQARGHVRAGAHVARLLLDPDDLAQVRVARDLLLDLALREGGEELDARDRHALVVLARGVALEVVEDLARAQGEAGDLLLVDPRLAQDGEEAG